jgi:hypothetical protein
LLALQFLQRRKNQSPPRPARQNSKPNAQPPVTRIRVGPAIANSNLLEHPHPIYPPEAKAKKVQGAVKLDVIIGRDGFVKRTKVISGDALLAHAAMDAAGEWNGNTRC